MRIVALLATYNERRFVGACIEHLREHGVEAFLIDNSSEDGTVDIATGYLGDGLIGIETLPRVEQRFQLFPQLLRKEELARELSADWFLHLDADELRLPPPGAATLGEALETADREGFNAVDFTEYTFLPTVESPDHDHADYQSTLRTYYPRISSPPDQLTAWKATADVELARTGGHRVRVPELRICPEPFRMKHYMFLSKRHAVEKYVRRGFDPAEVRLGLHGWRARITESQIRLPRAAQMRIALTDEDLDPSEPRRKHFLALPELEDAPPRENSRRT